MRVLTYYEREQFDMAFSCIMRLSSVYDGKRDISIIDVICGSDPLPPSIIKLVVSLGGLGAVVNLFCPLYRQEATDRLINYCLNNQIQPSSFALSGALGVGIKRPYTVVYEFKDAA